MASKILTFACATFISGIAACSDLGEANKTPDYVTNAEYVLERIEVGNSTAIAFQVKPPNPAACEHMFMRIGKKDAAGEWQTTNEVFPGKDKRDNFGQYQLSNQIHFAEVDNDGEFGVIALGCKAPGKQLIAIQGLQATFEITPDKLNYIGEIALVSIGSVHNQSFFLVNVTDRTDFARQQLETQLPALDVHFQANIAQTKKHFLDLPPDAQADLEKITERAQQKRDNRRLLINARAEFNETVAQARLEKAHWERANGTNRHRHTDQQTAERRALNDNVRRLQSKLYRFDDWISRDIDFAIIQKYLALEKSSRQAQKTYHDKYPPLPLSQILTGETSSSPERDRLRKRYIETGKAYRDFEEKHDL